LMLAGLIVHTIVRRFQEFDYQIRVLTNEFTTNRTSWKPQEPRKRL
jgi:hypothetical protein